MFSQPCYFFASKFEPRHVEGLLLRRPASHDHLIRPRRAQHDTDSSSHQPRRYKSSLLCSNWLPRLPVSRTPKLGRTSRCRAVQRSVLLGCRTTRRALVSATGHIHSRNTTLRDASTNPDVTNHFHLVQTGSSDSQTRAPQCLAVHLPRGCTKVSAVGLSHDKAGSGFGRETGSVAGSLTAAVAHLPRPYAVHMLILTCVGSPRLGCGCGRSRQRSRRLQRRRGRGK